MKPSVLLFLLAWPVWAASQVCTPQLLGPMAAADVSGASFRAFDVDAGLVANLSVDFDLGFDQPGVVELYSVASGTAPTLVGQVDGIFTFDVIGFPTYNFAERALLTLVGSTLWVYTPQTETLRAIDVSDPGNVPPRDQWSWWYVSLSGTPLAGTPVDSLQLQIDGDRAYFFRSGGRHLVVADLSAPQLAIPIDPAAASPVPILSSAQLAPNSISGYALSGSRVFVAHRQTNEMLVYDYSDASAPSLEASVGFGLGDFAAVKSIQGSICVATNSGSAFDAETYLIDVQDPQSPQLIGVVPGIVGTQLDGRLLAGVTYTGLSGGVVAVDVLDPTLPLFVAGFDVATGILFDARIENGVGVATVVSFKEGHSELQAFDLSCSFDGAQTFDIVVTESITLESSDDEINGVSVEGADILIAGSGLPVHPDGVFDGSLPPIGLSVLIDGERTFGDINLSSGSSLILEGQVEADAVRVLDRSLLRLKGECTSTSLHADASSLIVSGRIRTEDLTVTNGSTITHDAEATTEAP